MSAATTASAAAEQIKKLLDYGSYSEDLYHLIAVAIRADEIQSSGADPEDCIWDDDDLKPFYEALGDDFKQIDSEARAICAAKRLCRTLQREEADRTDDDVTTLDCSTEETQLRRMLDIFGWGFPPAKR